MTAKEYLRSIGQLDRSISTKRRELAGLEHDKGRLSAVRYDTAKVHSSSHSDPTIIIDRIDRLQREITADVNKLVELKAEARKKISKVYHQRFIDLLTDIYINGMTLEQVAEIWSKNRNKQISDRTIQRWHGQALQIFRKENNMS